MPGRVLDAREMAVEKVPPFPRHPAHGLEKLERGGQGDRFGLLRDRGARLRGAPIDFLDGLTNLRAALFVGRRGQLTFQLGARQPQRLERMHALRVAHSPGQPLYTRAFQFFDAFLNPRLSVDESFARITHECLRPFPRGSVGPQP